MELVEFLRARLDEDEAAARACAEVYPFPWDVTDRGHTAYVKADEPNFLTVAELEQSPSIEGWLSDRLDHIARHDPARVLVDVEANRQIVELHEENAHRECRLCGHLDGDYPCTTLRLHALPFAGHPDYRPEWRPS